MNAPTYEIPAELRDFAEKSVGQARTAVSSLLGTVVKSAVQLQTSSNTVHETIQSVIAKGLDQVQANASSTFDFAQKLVRTRDVKEAFELQSAFLHSQIAAIQTQAKDLGALAQKATKGA
ncbi:MULTISPECIES: phasin [unclassified Methylobacterium]|uniref:phasin n=1 Tax=unclassified Methylobacterium TaxID=2615210 RepID=UPI0006F4EA47|nr:MULTISPECIES: phasin [unclassified Methylobacterium]KQO52074.1 phasin [Methylobacterium sp. Leaf86]KQO90461.1 phasin [Methylobacterium sp. Leaf91]